MANYKASNVALKVSSLAEMACGRRLGDECLAVGFELIQVTAADHTSLADHLLNIACLHVKSRQPAQLRFHFLMKCKSQQWWLSLPSSQFRYLHSICLCGIICNVRHVQGANTYARSMAVRFGRDTTPLAALVPTFFMDKLYRQVMHMYDATLLSIAAADA